MRRSLVLTPVLSALLASPAVAQFVADTTPRISVSVSRSARLVPDRVAIFATIEGSAETPADAARRAQQKLDAVLAAVKALGASADPVPVPYGIALAPNQG